MIGKLRNLAPALALALLAGSAPGTAEAQRRADHPRLRAALHELREARNELKASRDIWPPGYRDRAMHSIDDALNSVKTILAVKSVDDFRGVDRNPDFYRRFRNHPHLRAALRDLRDARDELKSARSDFGGMKDRALDDIEVAIGDILTLIRDRKR